MNWPTKKLDTVVDFCLGKMLDQKKNRGEPLPYLANVNVRWGEFDLSDLREMRFEPHEFDRYGLKYGDIVMCEGGEPGRCAIWKEQCPSMKIQKALHRIRPHDSLRPEFLYYFFFYKGRIGHLAPLFTGSTIKHLTREKLSLVEVPVPSLSTQDKIVSILSAYDDLIENNRRRIQLLEQAARLLYKEWFVHLRFPGHEHTRIIDGVPEGWEKMPLGDVAPLKYGKALKDEDRIPGLFPVYGSSGIVGTHTKALVSGPTIIVGRKGNVGSVYWSPDDCHPIDTVYFIDSERCSLFLYYTLQQMTFISTDVAVPGLNRDFAHSRPLLIADQKILRSFEETVLPLNKQTELLKRHNDSLMKARDLLLPKLINGEVVV